MLKKNSYAGCPGLSPAVLPQFTRKMRVTTRNREKFTKTPYFGGSRSFTVIDVDIPKKLVTIACYGEQYVCAYLQLFFMLYRRANISKMPLFRGVSSREQASLSQRGRQLDC